MNIRPWLLLAVLAAVAILPARGLIRQAPPADGAALAPRHRPHDQVTLFDTNLVAPGQVVTGDAVSFLGGARVEGLVEGRTMAVFGDTEIDGEVRGSVTVVLGDLRLGPNAHVGGDAVCIGGHFHRDPGAVVDGDVILRSITSGLHLAGPARRVWRGGFRLPGVWLAGLAVVALYALIAWIFPAGVRRCGRTLVERPGASVLAAFLTVLALPFLFVLLCATLIGIPAALFVLPAAIVALWTFGKTSFYALVGQAVGGRGLPPWLAVLAGGLVCFVVFQIPLAGLLLSGAVSLLMMGSVVATLAEAVRRQPSARSASAEPPLRG